MQDKTYDTEFFVFNWKPTIHNVLDYEKRLKESNKQHRIVNIVEDYTYPNWLQLDDSYYFTKQFHKAIQNFDGDFYFHIQGDVTTDLDIEQIEERMIETYKKSSFGVYAPNVDWTFWDQKSIIGNTKFDHLKVVRTTDCSFWCIHRDVIEDYKQYIEVMNKHNKYGWSIDLMVCALSYIRKRPVIRDYSYTVQHPTSTNYDRSDAEIEMHQLVNYIPTEVGKAYQSMHRNGNYLLGLLS
jgi:hypothetical protein